MRGVDVVNQPLSAFPYQGRYQPSTVVGHVGYQLTTGSRVIGFQVCLWQLLRLSAEILVFILSAGTAFKYSRQVLDALLAGVGSFRSANRIGDMPNQHQSLLPGFFYHSEIGLTGNERLHFDEVHTMGLEIIHGLASIVRRGNRNGAGEAGFRT